MADADVPVKYMDRTRHYYRALGYTRDYIWATFDDVPFSQLYGVHDTGASIPPTRSVYSSLVRSDAGNEQW